MSDSPNSEKNFERMFIAVSINDLIRENVSALATDLKKGIQFTGAHPSWVKPENWHFTLFFLGKTETDKIPAIKNAIEQVDADQFSIEIGGLGVFPNPKKPTVLWVGVSQNTEKLIQLQSNLVSELEKLGYKRDNKKFHPHLTLARIKSLKGVSAMISVIKGHESNLAGSLLVDKISLYKSDLKPNGAIYTPLFEKKLSVTS